MSERVRATQRRRRLQELGFNLEVTSTGKHYWREPETGRRISEDQAFAMLQQREEELLKEAGWEPVEIEGVQYWRRPDSGRLYSRGAAYDVLGVRPEEEEEEEEED